jgi:uncharacterized protein YndB with AHSA1/START domain
MTSTTAPISNFNPELDIVFERIVPITAAQIWAGWTQPDVLKKWFCPLPWITVEAQVDLQPGGTFYTVMRSPEGQDYPGVGCVLEVVENKRLVLTSAMGPGFRPSDIGYTSADNLAFTTIILIEPQTNGAGTKYTAIGRHATLADAKKHTEMGLHAGWGAALDQLVALMSA